MNPNLAALLYLVAGVLFILSLRGLSSPASSRQGNLLGMPIRPLSRASSAMTCSRLVSTTRAIATLSRERIVGSRSTRHRLRQRQGG